MAAYAALLSLMNTMDHIQIHPRLSISLDKKQVESLGEKIGFLLDFIEISGSDGVIISKEAELLESQIASAAHVAEDVIESHVVDQIQAGSISLLDLQTVIEDMDSVQKKVVNFKEEREFKDLKPTYPIPASSSSTSLASTGKSRMVGFDDVLVQLMDALTGQQSTLQIIPIVGMGGIGKTTLARNTYENSLILQHFHIRAWATISQEYSAREILSELLSCQSKSTGETEDQLGERLYKSLIGRRYLIILDDIWSIEAWDKIKRFFPDNNNRSRIVLTTRLSNMANYFGTSFLPLKLLDEENSWELFCENAFPQADCPPELEEIGMKVAKKCKGLPLLIAVIGALLRKSSGKYWEKTSENINSILNSGGESLDILSLSYSHLPAHLKPCFLYMGIFPEDHEIRVSQLIKLFVAEGFVKSNKTQSLEEVAEDYLKDLVDRNLILVRRLRWNGKIKTCRIHDLLRDLCLKTAQKEKFLCLMRVGDIRQGVDKERCFVEPHGLESASLTRSLLSINYYVDDMLKPFIKCKLLRVLSAKGSDYYMDDMLKQVNLRYLCISSWFKIRSGVLSSISLLWNLQTLIMGHFSPIPAPLEIWEMIQIRHLDVKTICLPDPPSSDGQDDEFVMRNLQTLKTVLNLRLSDEVCKRIPNVKSLKIVYDGDFFGNSSYDFGRLHKLESLYCYFQEKPNRGDLLQSLTLPSSLHKLRLRCSFLQWEDLTMIGSLPHLEVLQLDLKSVRGSEWNPVEGEFRRLKFLRINFCKGLINWNADISHFPVLEKLTLGGMGKLNEIPSGIGEIPTLHAINVYQCNENTGGTREFRE